MDDLTGTNQTVRFRAERRGRSFVVLDRDGDPVGCLLFHDRISAEKFAEGKNKAAGLREAPAALAAVAAGRADIGMFAALRRLAAKAARFRRVREGAHAA
jgi:hypothetical protein